MRTSVPASLRTSPHPETHVQAVRVGCVGSKRLQVGLEHRLAGRHALHGFFEASARVLRCRGGAAQEAVLEAAPLAAQFGEPRAQLLVLPLRGQPARMRDIRCGRAQ